MRKYGSKKSNVRKCAALLLCVLGISALRPNAGYGEVILPRPFYTEAYNIEDTYVVGIDPNVLFLLDTGSPMTFSPKGSVPSNSMPKSECAQALKECTYGSGARPFIIDKTGAAGWPSAAITGKESITATGERDSLHALYGKTKSKARGGLARFGRDVDSANNIIGDPDCYYTPYKDRPWFLTFKDKNWANWNGVGEPPTAVSPLEDGKKMSAADRANLKTYLPGGSNAGRQVPDSLKKHLVPNDSRLYQMKLVLWRLLSEENKQVLSRMKIAMATSYQEINYPNLMHADFYKYSPFGATATFQHGTGPDWATGISDINWAYAHSQLAFAGIYRNYYASTDKNRWRQVNRAVLKLPFDYLYKIAADGTYYGTANLQAFQKYINGIEAANGSMHTDPEMFADGKTPLSTAIYGRKDLMNGSTVLNAGDGSRSRTHKAIHFETGRGVKKQYYSNDSYLLFQDFLINDNMTGGNLRGGLAVGSVIDFFSPGTGNTHFLDFKNGGISDTRGYYPVIGSCQNNWLVVFTAANDDDPKAALKAHEAVSKLYLDTKNNGIIGREWNKNTKNWERKTFKMDSGIRTLVVGFVDPTATDTTSVKLRETLEKMAAYGMPHKDGTPNYNSKPYFANDVPSLIASLKAVLMRINADRFAVGAPTITSGAAIGSDASLYSATFKIEVFDQWEGWFTKYTLVSQDATQKKWEANEHLLTKGPSRMIYGVNPSGGRGSTAVSTIDFLDLGSVADIPTTDVAKFKTWLKTYNAQSLMGEMTNSGYTVVGDSEAVGSRDKRVYIQTNRGYLHALDDNTGNEEWAFIPPNVMEFRLKALKFSEGNWMEGDGTTQINSYPLKLLDGGLVVKDVRNSSGQYRTILIGNMGRGGNAVYAMDVTTPSSSPNFLWAIDNARYETDSVPLTDSVHGWGKAKDNKAYVDLGLTIVSPSLLSVNQKFANTPGEVGLLAGGLGYKLGSDSQGKVCYVFEPATGEVLRVMDGNLSGFEAPGGRQLGMVIAPITWVPDRDGTAKMFFTADSHGNVLFCDTSQPTEYWKLKSVFQLLSSGGAPLHIPQALAFGTTSNGDEWVFGGTCDIAVPDPSVTRKMENSEHYIWGQDLTRASGDVVTADLKKLSYEADSILPSYVFSGDAINYEDAGFKGWALKLRPETSVTGKEYVTTPPFLYDGVLIVSTFISRPVQEDMSSKDLCPELGDSKLYALNPVTGAGMWEGGEQALILKDLKISGVTAYDGWLYIAAKPFKSNALGNMTKLITDDGTLGGLGAPKGGGRGNIPLSADIPYTMYWKETF